MLLCLMSRVPKVVVLVGAAVNPLHTVFFVVTLTSIGPACCVQSQSRQSLLPSDPWLTEP